MTINTKYDVGQQVWVIDKEWRTIPCDVCDGAGYVTIKGYLLGCPMCRGQKVKSDETDKFVPCDATINGITYDSVGLYYDIGRSFDTAEEYIYGTEADAQAAADAQNGAE